LNFGALDERQRRECSPSPSARNGARWARQNFSPSLRSKLGRHAAVDARLDICSPVQAA
jgi:hypothetical protein